jgi:hypothetical protein
MFDQQFVEKLAQALVARILPQLQNGNGNGAKPTPQRLLGVREAAIYLGRYKVENGVRKPSCSSIYHLVSRREIPCTRHGKCLRFDVRDLDRWIDGDKK